MLKFDIPTILPEIPDRISNSNRIFRPIHELEFSNLALVKNFIFFSGESHSRLTEYAMESIYCITNPK